MSATVEIPACSGAQVTLNDHGVFTYLPAPTKPGDSVTLRAGRDVHVIVTACSMDVEPINGLRCTPLRLEVSR